MTIRGVFAAVVLLAGALAHARATRLLTADQLTLPLRAAIVRRYGTTGLGYAVHCRWCAGLWLALPLGPAVAHLAALPHPWPVGLLLALAYSHATALLAALEDED